MKKWKTEQRIRNGKHKLLAGVVSYEGFNANCCDPIETICRKLGFTNRNYHRTQAIKVRFYKNAYDESIYLRGTAYHPAILKEGLFSGEICVNNTKIAIPVRVTIEDVTDVGKMSRIEIGVDALK
jgi:hypothetical protein